MAKYGEGDSRWIVESRSDGRNVGNWHWTEADYSKMVHELLEKEVGAITLSPKDGKFTVTVTSVSTTGEVSVSSRKGKVITFYELDCTANWSATHVASGTTAKGTLRMPYISEENDYDDFEIETQVTGTDPGSADGTFKDAVRGAAPAELKKAVPKVLTELQRVAREKLLLPTAAGDGAGGANAVKTEDQERKAVNAQFREGSRAGTSAGAGAAAAAAAASVSSTAAAAAAATKTDGKFELREKFRCTPQDMFLCLTDKGRVQAYAGSSANMTTDAGGVFSLFDGAISGTVISVKPNEEIKQQWRMKDWKEGHFSTVTISITSKSGQTTVVIDHRDIPNDDVGRVREGWGARFFAPIRGIFGFGSVF